MRMPRGNSSVASWTITLLAAAALLTGCVTVRVVKRRPGEPVISFSVTVRTPEFNAATPTATPHPTDTPAPTRIATPTPAVTPSPTCGLQDVGHTDGTPVTIGQPFIRVSRLFQRLRQPADTCAEDSTRARAGFAAALECRSYSLGRVCPN
jgi:hypothetical protein